MIRRLVMGIGVLLFAVIAFFGSIIAASEIGREVVSIRTLEPDGGTRTTRLWIADADGAAWLRAGMGRVPWVEQAEAAGELVMVRGDDEGRFRVTVLDDAASRERIHALMSEKYGLADRYIYLLRDGSSSVAVRLEPVSD